MEAKNSGIARDCFLLQRKKWSIMEKSFLIQKRIIETQSVILLMIFIFQISLKSIQ